MSGSVDNWDVLPDHVLIAILSYLSPKDRASASCTCRAWHASSKSPHVWRQFHCIFCEPDDVNLLKCVEKHGQFMRNVSIKLDQHEAHNRENACRMLSILSSKDDRCLRCLKITFIGENPLFYAGLDFVDVLKNIFRNTTSDSGHCSLRHVDLSGLYVAFDQTVIDILSENNTELESLNVINETQICKVHPDCITRLVERCKNLCELKLFHCSLSDRTLRELAQPDHTPLHTLSILCRKEERISKGLSSEAWVEFTQNCPDVKVHLMFDHTCPLNKVSGIMKSAIPVVELQLETHTDIYNEVNQAANLYNTTLKKVVLQTRNSPELVKALIHLCSSCPKLTSLLVYCVLDQEVVQKLLDLCPLMKERGTYILKWTLDPEPWLMKVEEHS